MTSPSKGWSGQLHDTNLLFEHAYSFLCIGYKTITSRYEVEDRKPEANLTLKTGDILVIISSDIS